ncbi:MAG: carbohydrate ABC transporter permease [Trueperaceae bacterium]|nr:carbohydrate ABC transporter permease [Trueperaceae bacterium]
MTRGRDVGRAFLMLGAFLVFLFSGGPVLLAFIGSIVPDQAIFSYPPNWFGHGVTLDNYRYIFTGELPSVYQEQGATRSMISDAARQVPRALMNSMIVAGSVALVNLLLGAPAGFAYARMRFRGRILTFMGLIMAPLVPSIALIVPYYLLVQEFGLVGSRISMIAIHSVMTLPFTVLILSVFFRRVPGELHDAARVDGCTPFQVFTRIFVPLVRPSLLATGLFAFMLSYAEFMFAHALGGGSDVRLLPVVMAALARNPDVSWGLLNASIFVAVVPSLVLVVVVWRFVVEGLMLGGVKG